MKIKLGVIVRGTASAVKSMMILICFSFFLFVFQFSKK